MVTVLCTPCDAQARVYRVKKGDWLGKIGRRFLPGDPFGKNGSVKRIVRLNPDIHNPDTIEPNELVYIPDVLPKTSPKKSKRHAHAKRTRRKPSAAMAAASTSRTPRATPAPPPQGTLPTDATSGGNVKACQVCPPAAAIAAPSPCAAPGPCVCATTTCKEKVAIIMQSKPDAQAPISASLHRHLRLRLAPYFRFSELAAQDDDTGAAITLASRYNTGLTAGLGINALEYLEISLDMRGGMLDYASPSKNSALLTSALFTYAITAGGELTILKRLGIYLGLSFGNEPFSMSDSTQIQEVTMINLPAATGALRLTALRFEHWLLGAEVQGAYKLGAAEKGYVVHPGTWLYAGAYCQWLNPDDTSWAVSVGYSQRQQNTTLITQTDKNISVEASYRWAL